MPFSAWISSLWFQSVTPQLQETSNNLIGILCWMLENGIKTETGSGWGVNDGPPFLSSVSQVMHTAGNHVIDAQVLSHQQAVNGHKFCFKGSKISLILLHSDFPTGSEHLAVFCWNIGFYLWTWFLIGKPQPAWHEYGNCVRDLTSWLAIVIIASWK